MMAETREKIKQKGMDKAALGVDAENPSDALQLYKKMNFEVNKKVMFLRKRV